MIINKVRLFNGRFFLDLSAAVRFAFYQQIEFIAFFVDEQQYTLPI